MKKFLKIFWLTAGFVMLLFCIAQATVIVPNISKVVTADELVHADAIIVLGARVYESGAVSPVLADRLDYAIDAYEAGYSDKIIVSGDGGAIYDEVKAMRKYLEDRGVPKTVIIDDGAGVNTFATMLNAKEFGCDSAIISTQKFHSYRALYLADAADIDAVVYASKDKAMYNMPFNHMRESLARIKAIYSVMTMK